MDTGLGGEAVDKVLVYKHEVLSSIGSNSVDSDSMINLSTSLHSSLTSKYINLKKKKKNGYLLIAKHV